MAIKQAGEAVRQGVTRGQFAYSTELLDLFVQLAYTLWRGREFKTEFISRKDKLGTVPNTLILSIGQL